MDMHNELFTRYMNNECTVEEITELLQHFQIAEDEKKLKELIVSALNDNEPNNNHFEEEEPELDAKLFLLYDRIKKEAEIEPVVVKMKRPFAQWYGIAAGIALCFSVGLILWHIRQQKPGPQQAAYHITPGSNKATLVLADGKRVDLLQADKGLIANQGNITIAKKADDQLVYSVSDANSVATVNENRVEVPKGGQYRVKLPDGTQVWMNSASSLSYDASFNGNIRNVSLTGEAYFEVAKDKKRPFIVTAEKVTIEVLGTHFNVMSYADEASINTTLLEGSVKVSNGTVSKTIVPGEEARTKLNIQVVQANIKDAIAWKNAEFSFVNADIRTVMRQIERWYNTRTVYEGELPASHFNAQISKNTDIKKLLNTFEQMGGVHFKINRDVIVVSR